MKKYRKARIRKTGVLYLYWPNLFKVHAKQKPNIYDPRKEW